MTKESDFYAYRTTNRGLFASFVASESTRFTKVGTRTKQSRIDIFKLFVFSGSMDVLEAFDPASILHMFNAREMRDWQDQLNDLNDTHYNLNWALYYTEEDLADIGIWYDDENGGVWMDSRDGGVWFDDNP